MLITEPLTPRKVCCPHLYLCDNRVSCPGRHVNTFSTSLPPVRQRNTGLRIDPTLTHSSKSHPKNDERIIQILGFTSHRLRRSR
jgi:hypothetical protein